MLILVFEVFVQPPKTHFLTFSKVQKHIMEKKSETKIMKITHSAYGGTPCTQTILTRKNTGAKVPVEAKAEATKIT